MTVNEILEMMKYELKNGRKARMIMTPHECSTIDSCPFSFTDASDQAQNYGCLPEPLDIVSMRVDFGKTWACHSDTTKPCAGSIRFLKEKNLPFKVIDKELVTELDDWTQFIAK